MQNIIKGINTFFGTGSGTASVTIPQESGQIVCQRLGWDSAATGTLVIYRGSYRCKANAAVAADTTLVIKTDAAGKVEGYTPTTSDYVLVNNSTSGATRWYLASISSVAAVSSSTRSLGLGGAVTCAADDAIFIVSNSLGDIISMATAAESVRDIYYAFCSRRGMPVHLLLTATGTDRIFGMYTVQD